MFEIGQEVFIKHFKHDGGIASTCKFSKQQEKFCGTFGKIREGIQVGNEIWWWIEKNEYAWAPELLDGEALKHKLDKVLNAD